jgi:hypothetical protein
VEDVTVTAPARTATLPVRRKPARPRLSWRGGLFALALLGSPAEGRAATGDGSLEYVVKAAYLYKFTPFVEWPPAAFANASSPFNICVMGADPLGSSLEQVLAGHQVGEHSVRVRRLQATDQPDDCQILYAAASRAQVAAALNKVKGAPVLTVTEQSLGVSGAMVQFYVKDGHVRFTLDPAAAQAHGMMISAKLLSLAAAIQAGS